MNRNIVVKFVSISLFALTILLGSASAKTATDLKSNPLDWFAPQQSQAIQAHNSTIHQIQDNSRNLPDMLDEFDAQQQSSDDADLMLIRTDEMPDSLADLAWLDRMTLQLHEWQSTAFEKTVPEPSFSDCWYIRDLLLE